MWLASVRIPTVGIVEAAEEVVILEEAVAVAVGKVVEEVVILEEAVAVAVGKVVEEVALAPG